MKHYDITVIGGGPGGQAAAITAARLGAKVVLIEKNEIGGVCLNVGCIPTKTLIASATLYAHMRQCEEFGIKASRVESDYAAMVNRKNRVISTLKSGIESQLKRWNVDVIKAQGKIKDPKTIECLAGDNSSTITADKIIIATGSRSREIPGLAVDGNRILDSTGVLAMATLPQSIVIVGGGYIGCEFANIFNDLGVSVTIVEALASLLPRDESDLGKRLALIFKKRGIEISTGITITSVQKKTDALVCTTNDKREIVAEKILVAVGRERNVTEFGLEGLSISMSQGAIVVNDYFQTNVAGIYAIGDVLASPQLAHVATHEGICAAHNAMGNSMKMDYRIVPNCIYTRPEIATVGMSKTEAQKQGVPCSESRFLYSALGKAYCIGETEGFIKLTFRSDTKEILGCQIMGAGATDIIAEVSIVLTKRATVDEVAHTIHAHPTLSEIVQEAALEAENK
jgi:dihydrolipoamide dehydrogenase